jgi:glycolate oxidase
VLVLTQMNRILEAGPGAWLARVEAGVPTTVLSDAAVA